MYQHSHLASTSSIGRLGESIRETEQMVLKFQIQKKDFENEYNKIPESHRRSFLQKDRKDFLSTQIDKLAQQINEGKLFIRRKRNEKDKHY